MNRGKHACALMCVLNSMVSKTAKQNAFRIQVPEKSKDKIEAIKRVKRVKRVRIVSIMHAKQLVKRAMASHAIERIQ